MKKFFKSTIACLMSAGFMCSAVACGDSGNQENKKKVDGVSYTNSLLTQVEEAKTYLLSFEETISPISLDYSTGEKDEHGYTIYNAADYVCVTKGTVVLEKVSESYNAKLLLATNYTTTDENVPEEYKVRQDSREVYFMDGFSYVIEEDEGKKTCKKYEMDESEIAFFAALSTYLGEVGSLKESEALKSQIAELVFSEDTLLKTDNDGNVSFGFDYNAKEKVMNAIKTFSNIKIEEDSTLEEVINEVLSALKIMKDETNPLTVADLMEMAKTWKTMTLGNLQATLELKAGKTLDELKNEVLNSAEFAELLQVIKNITGGDIGGTETIDLEELVNSLKDKTVAEILNTYLQTEDYKLLTLEELVEKLSQIDNGNENEQGDEETGLEADETEKETNVFTWDGAMEKIQAMLEVNFFDFLEGNGLDFVAEFLFDKPIIEKIEVNTLQAALSVVFSSEKVFQEMKMTLDLNIKAPEVGEPGPNETIKDLVENDKYTFINFVLKVNASIQISSTPAAIALPEGIEVSED